MNLPGLRPIVLSITTAWQPILSAQESVAPCPLEYYRAPQDQGRAELAQRIKDDLTLAWQLGERELVMAVACAGAAARLPLAEIVLAGLVSEGRMGVQRDPARARAWLLRAANAGDAEAKMLLSNMYIEGEGGPVMIAEGLSLLRSAAEAGNANAQFLLGGELITGVRMRADIPAGIRWLESARGAGHAGAVKLLRELGRP